jgi:predicted RNase H-like nuclease
VDIPIGLPTAGRRSADVAARDFVGPRRNSVFLTPVGAALEASTHAEATARSRQLTGVGVSQQAYALGPKIFEAERWRQQASAPVWEVHPEVSFAVLLGHPATAPKKTWAGVSERVNALRSAGIELNDLGEAGRRAAVDDAVDAAVAAWSAGRLVHGKGVSLPDPPDVDPVTGEAVAIWA